MIALTSQNTGDEASLSSQPESGGVTLPLSLRFIARSLPDGLVAGSLLDGLVARTLLDGLVARSLLDWLVAGSLLDGLVARSLLDGLVAGSLPDGLVAGSLPDGLVAGSLPDGLVAGSLPDGLVAGTDGIVIVSFSSLAGVVLCAPEDGLPFLPLFLPRVTISQPSPSPSISCVVVGTNFLSWCATPLTRSAHVGTFLGSSWKSRLLATAALDGLPSGCCCCWMGGCGLGLLGEVVLRTSHANPEGL